MKLRALKAILIVLISHHVIVTLLYLGPINPLSLYYGTYVVSYMNPLFSQNWEFFGRNLQTNWPVVQYKCNSDAEWKNFASGVFAEHLQNRFIGSGKKYYFYNYLVKSLTEDYSNRLKTEADPTQSIASSKTFKLIMNLIGQGCSGTFHSRLAVISQPKFSERNSNELQYVAIPLATFNSVRLSQ